VLGCHLASCIAQLERQYRLLIIVTFVGGLARSRFLPLSTACNLVNDRWNQVPESNMSEQHQGENASKDEQLASRFSWVRGAPNHPGSNPLFYWI
jgi:hypothetical protein